MYALKANFYPAQEPKNGYIGKADITVANGVRLNNISVFEKDGVRSISFAKFGKEGEERSYIIPSSKEAYAAMLEVVEKAVAAENHFGYSKGDLGIRLDISGAKVSEPYADGRYVVHVGDLCLLNGVATREVPYEKDGKPAPFVSVDLPTVSDGDGKARRYNDKDGKEQVDYQYEFLQDSWTDKEGKKQKIDYNRLLTGKVMAKRKELMEPSLDEKIANSEAMAASEKSVDAPVKDEQTR